MIESLTQARLLIVSRNFARHLMDLQCFFSIGKDRVGEVGDARGWGWLRVLLTPVKGVKHNAAHPQKDGA